MKYLWTLGIAYGDWEKIKGGKVILTIVERLTSCYLSILIVEKNTDGSVVVMAQLKQQYSDKFCEVFKAIITDNGSEFADFADSEAVTVKQNSLPFGQ